MIEDGSASFVVLEPEALGLSAPPTDLQQLPDGRILVVARNELALGDGFRWEIYRQNEADRGNDTVSVAIDPHGAIYAGVQGGFGRVDFGRDGHWRLTTVAPLPVTDAHVLRPVLTNVVATEAGWYWHSGSGAVIAWQPGEIAQIVGGTNTIERVFTLGADVFISNRSDGALLRVEGAAVSSVISPAQTTPNDTVTCGTPYDAHHLLVGTNAEGLKLFDGERFLPFAAPGLPSSFRINDLCGTAGGFFAVAVDNAGIVILDENGRIVQMLDRSLDHRLSRVQRLFYASGTLWALLNNGIARIRFPSRLSSFEPLVSTGLAFAQPLRHDGRLWLLADGRAQRGVYSPEGRLLRFADDSPPGTFVHTLSTQLGPLLATNDNGIYRRHGETWELALGGLAYARLDLPSADGRRWFYVARGELGWISLSGESLAATRYPHPELQEVYGVSQDGAGTIWLELGAGRIGRVQLGGEQPRLDILAAANGVADGWVNIFVLDGIARFNIANRLFRFNDAQSRLFEDDELVRRYPPMANIVGRPVRDPRGRLWLTAGGTVHRHTDSTTGPTLDEPIPTGIRPVLFTVEKNGVIWMQENRRLTRYDPAMPEPSPPPLCALITQVHLTSSDHHLFDVGPELPQLPYADNSLIVHYLAPGTALSQSVSFDVRLDGAGDEWTSAGSSGSTAFNRLKEGRYLLHIRPRSGSLTGRETTLAFAIEPPWFRSTPAYALYALSALTLVLSFAWWFSYLERREKARLEHLVGRRTSELNETNARLAGQVRETLDKATALVASEERYRRLNEELEHRVEERTSALTVSNRELESFSYSISHDLRAPLRNISGFADLLRKRLAGHTDAECDRFLGIISGESIRLGQLIDALLVFSRLGRSEMNLQLVDLAQLVADTRAELAAELAQRTVEFRVDPLPSLQADPTLLRQVFANLLSNAVKFTRHRTPAIIEIGTLPSDSPKTLTLFVRDNGVGFDPKYTDKLFGVFQRLHHARDFEGTGIGLANVRRIVLRHGGRIWAEGRLGEGATFYFTLPIGLRS